MKRLLIPIALAGLLGCNEHPVSTYIPNVGGEMQRPTSVDPSGKLDILWVIDNSGSMCQEQAILRENFDRFIGKLDEAVVDFHIAVTTTHMEDDHPMEPVARPGHLQSTPQPLPGFDRTCWTATDDEGRQIPGDYTPIRQLIAAAVACMETPDESLLNRSDADIECALNCDAVAECRPDECGGLRLFPDSSTYRSIPKVLEASRYRAPNGTLDVETLKADFACMSLVGMRGYGFEKGLGAVVEAVSPELTGGTLENPTNASAPNHGFIRSDALFAAVFVTDENDCTHDGSLSERHACTGDICEYWNHPSLEDNSPLVSPTVLRDAMLANLRATKAEPTLDVEGTLVASIHGNSRRYAGNVVPDDACRVDSPIETTSCGALSSCSSPGHEELGPTCASRLGSAYSGDRYERFLRSFGEGRYFPPSSPGAPDNALPGWMCTGDFKPALLAIAEFFQSPMQGCVTSPIQTCEPTGEACPDHVGGEPGACVPLPNSGAHFCTSHVQVRISADAARLDELRTMGFCSTHGDSEYCVVSRDAYALDSCSGGVAGFRVTWLEPEVARQSLAGTDLELRWRF